MIRIRLAAIYLFWAAGLAQGAVSARILLGVGDSVETNWDGEVAARGARIAAVEPWRFDSNDAMLPGNRWKMSTHPVRVFAVEGVANPARPVVPNGILVQLDGETENSEVEVRTPRGTFVFHLSEIPYGTRKSYLQGKALVDRVPEWSRVTNQSDEQDYPAVAMDRSGTLWVTYMEFMHNPEHDRIRLNPELDLMNAKTRGDQILARSYANNAWGKPIPVSSPGGDLYRPAISVDGQSRVWVFWSANEGGDFDIWGRPVENGQPGPMVRISNAAGADIDPVAATDSDGHVVVAWQGWRNGKASIFMASQNSRGFSAPVTVSASAGNEWNPAITADKSGRVAVAWDSYRNGNYDVFFRARNARGNWTGESAVAAASTYEAYPSIAYDSAGTLWVAYEEGGERWGKDFGLTSSEGISVYQGRAIRLRGFTASGATVETASDPGTVMPGIASRDVDAPSRQADVRGWLAPNPDAAKRRGPGRGTPPAPAPKNTLPRLIVDASGRLWLAFRSPTPIFWSAIGTVWSEYVASYSGSQWTGSIYLHHSDNILDNRPALVSPRPGELLVIQSSDGRREFKPMTFFPGSKTMPEDELSVDPYRNDLYVSRVALGPAAAAAAVRPARPPTAAGVDPRDQKEQSTVAALRNYRMKSSQGNLRILRGEFHRHSEISMDGAGDGTLLDQYRYLIDGAYMDWAGCCDHDNGGAREYSWWISQKLTDIFHSPVFVPMFSYERSVAYPEGHRNVIFAQRGIRPLPRLAITADEPAVHAPDTQMLYAYLKKFNGIVASHTSGTNMGTDWRDNDPDSEPSVEIYQGDRQNYEMPGAPRSNNERDSIGGWRPKGFISLALEKGYKLSFEASSDHVSTHMSYANILATDNSRESILKALQKRHIYAATDDILADYRSGDHIMGDAFSTSTPPELRVKLAGTAPFARVYIIKDSRYVYTISPGTPSVEFTWRDANPEKGKVAYYYVRGEQTNGELVWASPMWITYTGK